MFNEKFGRRVRYFRKKTGLTQIELAKAVGYTSSGTISLVERGVVGVELSKLMKIADTLGVPASILIADEDLSEDQIVALTRFVEVLTKPNAKHREAILALLK